MTACARSQRFVEKPDAATAQAYLDAGGYFWNSGMFLFRASRYLEELRALRARHRSPRAARRFGGGAARRRFPPPGQGRVRGLPVGFDRLRGDGEDRPRRGAAGRRRLERRRLVVGAVGCQRAGRRRQRAPRRRDRDRLPQHATPMRRRLVALVGRRRPGRGGHRRRAAGRAQGPACSRSRTSSRSSRPSSAAHADLHRKVYRPWGSYDSIDTGEGFQVKRIKVKPGARLSLQMHHAPRRALDRGQRHRARDLRRRRVRTAREPVAPTSRSARSTGWRTRARRCWS